MTERQTTVYEEIKTLLETPAGGADPAALAHVEHTLTTGYAHALALEAERMRVARRIDEITAGGDPHEELSLLTERLQIAAGELKQLRALLRPLKLRASELRLAAAATRS